MTASDLINELAQDDSVSQFPNSKLFKEELVKKVTADEIEGIDMYVVESIREALKSSKSKIDLEFYELTEFLADPEPVAEAVQENNEEEAIEVPDSVDEQQSSENKEA